MSVNNKIPDTLHVIYGLWDNGKIPKKYIKNIYYWRSQGWQINIWNKSNLIELIHNEFPDFIDIFSSVKRKVQLADLARLMVIYSKGGLYIDLDTLPTNNLFEYISCLKSNHLFFIESYINNEFATNQALIHPIRKGLPELNERLANFAFAACPKNEIIKSILQLAKSRIINNSAFDSDYDIIFKTGPDCLTTAVNRFRNVNKTKADNFIVHLENGKWRNNKDYSINFIHYYFKKILQSIFHVYNYFIIKFIRY